MAGGWRDAIVTGGVVAQSLAGGMNIAALADSAGYDSPLEQSTARVIDDFADASGDAVEGRAEGEDAADAEPVPESEYGDYRDFDDGLDDTDFEFESLDAVENIAVAEPTDAIDSSDAMESGSL